MFIVKSLQQICSLRKFFMKIIIFYSYQEIYYTSKFDKYEVKYSCFIS